MSTARARTVYGAPWRPCEACPRLDDGTAWKCPSRANPAICEGVRKHPEVFVPIVRAREEPRPDPAGPAPVDTTAAADPAALAPEPPPRPAPPPAAIPWRRPSKPERTAFHEAFVRSMKCPHFRRHPTIQCPEKGLCGLGRYPGVDPIVRGQHCAPCVLDGGWAAFEPGGADDGG